MPFYNACFDHGVIIFLFYNKYITMKGYCQHTKIFRSIFKFQNF